MRVANHDAVELAAQRAVRRQFDRVQLRAGALDDRQLVVRIVAGGGVAGEMFAATGDPARA